MVLYMRKIASVVLALIMLMSAVPVFAEGEQQVDSADSTAATEAAEQLAPQETVAAPSDSKEENKDSDEKDLSVEETEWVDVTICDTEGNKLEDKVKVQIQEGISVKKMLEEFDKEKHYDLDWEKCRYIVNNKEEIIDIDNYKLEDEDSLLVIVNDKVETDPLIEKAYIEDEMHIDAVAPETLQNAYSSTKSKAEKIASDSNWEFGSEWIVMGLSRSESMTDSISKAYCDRVAAYVNSVKSDQLSNTLSSDNSRLVLTLTSLGYDPTDVCGYNMLKPLANMNYLTRQGLSGPVWALIAFDSHDYEIPKAGVNQKQTTREGLVDLLVSSQVNNQGWDMSGRNPDVDMTCMVLQALTPYYNNEHPQVKKAVDNALIWLSSVQNADGSFSTGTVSSESQSQVIVALTGLGIDPEKDSRFVKGNNSAMDALMKFYVSGGGFKHVSENWKFNELATQQGYYALAAYYRFKNGKSSLYNMREIDLVKFIGVAKAGDTGRSTVKRVETAGKAMGHTRSLGYLALHNGKIDKSLTKEDFDNSSDNQDALSQQKSYNDYIKTVRVAKTLPWIYMAIGAMALIGLILILRNRKPE